MVNEHINQFITNDQVVTGVTSALMVLVSNAIIMIHNRAHVVQIMSVTDLLKFNLVDGKMSLMIPIISAGGLLALYYSEDWVYYLGKILLLHSVVVVFTDLNRLFTWLVPMDKYQIGINKTDLPIGYLEEIDYKEFDDPKKVELFLVKNNIPVIKPKPVIPESSYIFNKGSSVALVLSVLVTWGYEKTKHWMLSNIIAVSFIFYGFDTVGIENFKIGFSLLSGLFFYDVYFVFFSDVMETVAAKVDSPIKLIIPNLTGGFSILGLGDIVVPGLFINLCYQYNSTYYIGNLIAYNLGLLESGIAVAVFQSGQPALFYIVPNMLLTTFLIALFKGELKAVWKYTVFNYEEDTEAGETDDEDYEINSQDEWELEVEELDTDIDELNHQWSDIDEQELRDVRIDAVYNFIDESDDDTFVISNGESSEDGLDDSNIRDIDDSDSDQHIDQSDSEGSNHST